MTTVVVALCALFVGASAVGVGERVRRGRALGRGAATRRIAFPFTGLGLSEPALAAALRIARVEHATLMPVYLALVPLEVALGVPLAGECEAALPLLEAIEQRAARADVRVDSRIERGRSVRHALAAMMAHERFDRTVVAAGAHGRRGDGLAPEDIAWLLDRAPGEVIALRPGADAQPLPTRSRLYRPGHSRVRFTPVGDQ